jgi:hypothetical protein
MVSRRANLVSPTVMVSPTFFPSCLRVTAPSSIWSFPGQRLAAGGRRLDRAEVPLQAEHRKAEPSAVQPLVPNDLVGEVCRPR